MPHWVHINTNDPYATTGKYSQLQVRVDQIVKALQEDDIDSESGEYPRSRGCHPVDRACPPGPAVPEQADGEGDTADDGWW